MKEKEYYMVIKPNCKNGETVEEFLEFLRKELPETFKGFKLEKGCTGEYFFVKRVYARNFAEDLVRYPCKWIFGLTLRILSKEFNRSREERS